MINKDRIIPIQKCDFLTMVGIVMHFSGASYDIAYASDVEGNFTITAAAIGQSGVMLCNEPVKTLTLADGVANGIVYFVPAYDFAGITIGESEVEADVKADGITLYKADIVEGVVTVTPISPIAE